MGLADSKNVLIIAVRQCTFLQGYASKTLVDKTATRLAGRAYGAPAAL